MTDRQNGIEAVYRAVRAAVPNVAHDATPAPAVAVALWRRKTDSEIEVYLVRRSPKLRFLGGHWSFPGGRVESEDGPVDGDDSVLAAAVRELREELGVRLPTSWGEYLRGSRWITPEAAPVRFDTVYLVHEYRGPEPDPACSEGEIDAGCWIDARGLRDKWEQGEWLVPSPIARVVRAISELNQDPGELSSRLDEEAAAEERSPRLWSFVAGIGVCPLRTPTLPPATHTNCVVVGADELVVIDPAPPSFEERVELERVLDAALDRGRRFREVLLTHHHGDHVGAARYVADRLNVPIAAHPETARLLEGIVVVDRYVHDGELIALAGKPPRSLRAIHTPGHAAGHLCFLEENTRTLVAGDMVAGVGTILIEPHDGDMALYIESLEKLRALPLRSIVPAHGPIVSDPQRLLGDYIEHRKWRESQVVEALEAGGLQSTADLVIRVYADVPPAVHPLAARSLLAHLQKLADEGRVRSEGDTWELTAGR